MTQDDDGEFIDIDAEAEALSASDDGEPATKEEIREWIYANMRARSRKWLDPNAGSSIFSIEVTIDEAWAEKTVPRSDLNAARELGLEFRNLVTHVPRGNVWRVWNGVYHEQFDDELLLNWLVEAFIDVHREALGELKEYYETAASVLSGDAAAQKMKEYQKTVFGEHRAYRDAIHKNAGINALAARVKIAFSVPSTHFDNDRRWLVAKNGVIDLDALRRTHRTAWDYNKPIELLEHDPARPVWRQVNANYDPGAVSEVWRGFLGSSVPDADSRKLLGVATGACIAAERKIKLIPVLQGPMNSGKSVYLDVMNQILGGYADIPHNDALKKVQGTNFTQEALRGVRFIGFSEPDTARQVDDGFIKGFSGGDAQKTRAMYMNEESWEPQGVIFIATNKQLKFKTDDAALRKRLATVWFPHEHVDARTAGSGAEHFIDFDLEKKLLAEADGVFSWIMAGLLVYLIEGIPYVAAVEQNREEQLMHGSPALQWLNEVMESGQFVLDDEKNPLCLKGDYVLTTDAYQDYIQWHTEVIDDKPLSNQKLREGLEFAGVHVIKPGGKRRFNRLVPFALYNHRSIERSSGDDVLDDVPLDRAPSVEQSDTQA